MRVFIKYFPIVYAYGSGVFILFVLLQRAYLGSWSGGILRYNPPLWLVFILVILLLGVSGGWLFADVGSDQDNGKDR